MKSYLFVTTLSLLISSFASAASFNQSEQNDLNQVLQNKIKISWECVADGKSDAVMVIQVNNNASALRSSNYVLVVQDQKVAEALGFPYYPAVLAASGDNYNIRATEGYNEPTTEFYSDSGGMKLVAISNGASPTTDWNQNWFFNGVDCHKF